MLALSDASRLSANNVSESEANSITIVCAVYLVRVVCIYGVFKQVHALILFICRPIIPFPDHSVHSPLLAEVLFLRVLVCLSGHLFVSRITKTMGEFS